MEAHEKKVCLANSYVEHEIDDRPIFNNGTLILHLLGIVLQLLIWIRFWNKWNTTNQVQSGNFVVIDSTGFAALYEIPWTEVEKYDVAETEEGYVIRTYFPMIRNCGS
ncbi:MAG: hypothetical protein RAO94_06255 [Candidatus Stygibacter australis]|nr:hypothetical protein [Candidatus Stygibacter australis]